MAGNFNKDLIQKFLSSSLNRADVSAGSDNKKERKEKELNETLSQSLAGDKAFGDISGLNIETNYAPREISGTQRVNKASDDLAVPFMPKKNSGIRSNDNLKNKEVEDALEVAILCFANADILIDSNTYLVKRDKTEKRDFKDLESVAEYILSKQNENYTKQDVLKLASELLIINSNGDEKSIEAMEENALKNINSGSVRYIDRTFNIYDNTRSYFPNRLKACGFEFTRENLPIYQLFSMIEKERLDLTYSYIHRDVYGIFKDIDPNDKKCIEKLKNRLTEAMEQYKGSPLAEAVLTRIDFLVENKKFSKKDFRLWEETICGVVHDYKARFEDILQTTTEFAENGKKDTEQFKKVMLSKYNINLYSKEEQDKVREIQLQNFTAQLLSSLYGNFHDMNDAMYYEGGLFNSFANKVLETAEEAAHLIGKDVYTNKEYIEDLGKNSEFFKDLSADKVSNEEFKKIFKSWFNKEYDEKNVEELLKYISENLDMNIFEDKEFQAKFKELSGSDIVTNEKARFKKGRRINTLGDIAFIYLGMQMVGAAMETNYMGFCSREFFGGLGLSGRTLQVVAGMPVGAATFGTYTLAEKTLDNILTEQGPDSDKWDTMFVDALKSLPFGAFASGLHSLAISPLTEQSVERGYKSAIEFLKNCPPGEIDRSAMIAAFYDGFSPIIKNEVLRELVYPVLVNAAGFTAYGTAATLIENGIEPFQDGNGLKYVGQVAWENMKNIMTFEFIKLLVAGSMTGRISNDAVQDAIADGSLEEFMTMNSSTFEKVIDAEGKTQFLIKSADKIYVSDSPDAVFSYYFMNTQQEAAFRKAWAEQDFSWWDRAKQSGTKFTYDDVAEVTGAEPEAPKLLNEGKPAPETPIPPEPPVVEISAELVSMPVEPLAAEPGIRTTILNGECNYNGKTISEVRNIYKQYAKANGFNFVSGENSFMIKDGDGNVVREIKTGKELGEWIEVRQVFENGKITESIELNGNGELRGITRYCADAATGNDIKITIVEGEETIVRVSGSTGMTEMSIEQFSKKYGVSPMEYGKHPSQTGVSTDLSPLLPKASSSSPAEPVGPSQKTPVEPVGKSSGSNFGFESPSYSPEADETPAPGWTSYSYGTGTGYTQPQRERVATEGVAQNRARVKVLFEEFKSAGADGDNIDKAEEAVENGILDGELSTMLQLFANSSLTDPHSSSGSQGSQGGSVPEIIYLNAMFDCPPEDIPNKVKAYLYARMRHFDSDRILEMVNYSGFHCEPEYAAANLSFENDEIEQRLENLLNIVTDKRIMTILFSLAREAEENSEDEFAYFELEEAIETVYRLMYFQSLVENIEDKTLRADMQQILDENLPKVKNLNDITDIVVSLGEILDYSKVYVTPSACFLGSLRLKAKNGESLVEELSKDPQEIEDARLKAVRLDMDLMDNYKRTIDLCTVSPKSETAAIEYEKYLDEVLSSCRPEVAGRIKKLCHMIEKDYGMRVFLSSDMRETGVALKLVYMEVANYVMRAKSAGQTANIPPVLNLSLANIRYFPSKKEPKTEAAGFYTSGENTISIDGATILMIKHALRHELMHANDTLMLQEFPDWFDPMMYIDEMLGAGLHESEVRYALKNPKEYIAKAAEGDMSKYSSGFKEALVALGMPRWAIDMSNPLRSKLMLPPLKRIFLETELEKEYYALHPEWKLISLQMLKEGADDEEGTKFAEDEMAKWLAEMGLEDLFGALKGTKDVDCTPPPEVKTEVALKDLEKIAEDAIAVLKDRCNSYHIEQIKENGYLSSREGLEALNYVINHFAMRGHGSTIPEAVIIMYNLKPEEVSRMIERGFDITMDIDKLINLSKLDDVEYARYLASEYRDRIDYISEIDELNELFVKIQQSLDKYGSRINLKHIREIDRIITDEVNRNPARRAEILKFYAMFFADCDYKYNMDKLENPKWMAVYKKAYDYVAAQGWDDAKIIIMDTDDGNVYNAGEIHNHFEGKYKENWTVAVFDKDGNFIRKSTGSLPLSTIVDETVQTPDGSISYMAETIPSGTHSLLDFSRKEVRDSEGKLIYIESYEKIDGANKYNIYRTYPDGRKFAVGLAYVNKAGETVIEKTIHHDNGLTTNYVYLEGPDGSKYSYSQITDENGDVTFEHSFRFKVIDENHFVSIEDGVEYDIQYSGHFVSVRRGDGKFVRIMIGSNSEHSLGILSRDLLPILKQLPGSAYFDIRKYGLKKIGLNIDDVNPNNAHYSDRKNLIAISGQWQNALFTLLHELGHYRDQFLAISKDPDVVATYMAERRAFTEKQSFYENDATHYFIDYCPRRTESISGSIAEITAEINAILYASNINPDIEMRSQFLQEFFPETFKIIAEKLMNENASGSVTRPVSKAAGNSDAKMQGDETAPAASSEEISKVVELIRKSKLLEDEKTMLEEALTNGLIDAETCQEYLNDETFANFYTDSYFPEDMAAKLQAYKYGKSQGFDRVGIMQLMKEAEWGTPIEVSQLKVKMTRHLTINFGANSAVTRRILENISTANYMLFEDNLELIVEYSYWLHLLTPENIDKLKLIKEYENLTGRNVYSSDGEGILTGGDDGAAILEQMTKEIAQYKQATAKLNESEKISAEDFLAILLADNKVEFNSRGYNELYEICENAVKLFTDEQGEVPSFAVEFLRELTGGLSLYGIKEFLQKISIDNQSSQQRTLSEEEMHKILDLVETIVGMGSDRGRTIKFLSEYAIDKEGNFSIDLIAELINKGVTVDEVMRKYDSCKGYTYGDNLYKVYYAMLDIMNSTHGLPDEVAKFVEKYLFSECYMFNSDYVIERCEAFKSNYENNIAFIQQGLSDGYITSPRDFTYQITDIMLEAYKYLPDVTGLGTYDRESLLEALAYVDENNIEIFKACISHGYSGKSGFNYTHLREVLMEVSDADKAKFVEELIPLLCDADGKLNVYKLKDWLAGLKDLPEVAKELIDNHISMVGVNPSNYIKFIAGPKGENGPVLDAEQRKLLYELMQQKDEDGNSLISLYSTKDRKYLLELKPENYDILKTFMFEQKKNFYNVAKSLCELQQTSQDKIDEVKAIIAQQPELVKYFSVEALISNPEKVQLLFQNVELLESIKQASNVISTDAIVQIASCADIERAFEVLKVIPEDIKQKYPKAMAEVYTIELAKNLIDVRISPVEYVRMLEYICKYDAKIRGIIEKACINNINILGSCSPEILDFAAEYIQKFDNFDMYEIEGKFLKQILASSTDLYEARRKVDEILQNKDKIIASIRIGLKDADAEYFVKFAEEFLNSDNAYFMIFIPNLDYYNVAEYLLAAAKIFYMVDGSPQKFINGEYNDEIIEGLKDYRKNGENGEKYKKLDDSLQYKVQDFDYQIERAIEGQLYNLVQIMAVTDVGAVQLLLAQRFSTFRDKVQELLYMPEKEKLILKDLIRKAMRVNRLGQPVELSGKQKLDMINIVKCIKYIPDFDLDKYKTPIKSKIRGKYILDIQRLRKDILDAILVSKGISPEELADLNPEDLNWNPEYISLLASTPGRDEGELADLVRETSRGNFEKYINDPSNKYGQANLRTKQAFEAAKLDFGRWEAPDLEGVKVVINGREFTIKLWGRNPQEDLFMGSETSCCTALDGGNGAATADYILNKSFNVIFLYDSNGKVVGMSRVYMAMIEGKPSLIMDNIELNQAYKHGNTDAITAIRDGFFKYAGQYAQKVTGNEDTQVYFATSYAHVKQHDLNKVTKEMSFIGSISRENIYINVVGNWFEYQNLSQYDLYEVPKSE